MLNRTKLIAETAWHHEGDFTFFNKLNSALLKTKGDIIKYHITIDADEYMDSKYSLFPSLKKWLFSRNQWEEIIWQTLNSGKEILFLVNDTKAVDFVSKYNPGMIEIHSVCLNDIHLLNAVKSTFGSTPIVFLGIGGSTLYEIERAISVLQNSKIVLMFGFQNYPTNYADINLLKMRKIMNLYPEFTFGYADHTAWDNSMNHFISLIVASQGMKYLEKHVTIEYGKERCDWISAINTEMFDHLSDAIAIIDEIAGNGNLELNVAEQNYSIFGPMKKAAITSKSVKKGESISGSNISFKRTQEISDLSQIQALDSFGNSFLMDLKSNTILLKSHISKKESK